MTIGHHESYDNNSVETIQEDQIKSLESLDRALAEKSDKASSFSALFWLVVFFPVGLYLIAKEKKLHHLLPKLMIIFGSVGLFFVITLQLFIVPKMSGLTQQVGATMMPTGWLSLWVFPLATALTEIGLGIYLKKQVKRNGFLKKNDLYLCLAACLVYFVLLLWNLKSSTINLITPMYNLKEIPSFEYRSIQ